MPVRGIVYFLAVAVAALVLGSVPGIGAAARLLPWYLRDLLLPGLAATLMGAIRVEGRNFHHAARALVRYGCGRRALVQAWRPVTRRRWHPHDLLVLPDGSDRRLRRLRYTGPGAVLVSVPHERGGRARERGSRAWARRGPGAEVWLRRTSSDAIDDRPRIISLGAGVKLAVRGELVGDD